MLKNIHPLLCAPLLHVLAAMGHGDEIAVVDRNYPAYSAGPPVITLDGVDTTAALAAILEVLPLDTFVATPLAYMESVDAAGMLPVHDAALAQAAHAEGRQIEPEGLARQEFYDRARSARAIVTTGEARAYGCFLLVKGVVT